MYFMRLQMKTHRLVGKARFYEKLVEKKAGEGTKSRKAWNQGDIETASFRVVSFSLRSHLQFF